MSDRPVVLIVAAAGMEAEVYRRDCLESVAAACDVVLITSDEPSWEVPFIRDCVVVPDPTDQAALSAAGRTLADRYDLADVFTWTERYLVPVARLARLARQLGLTATSPEAMQACRNKATARSLSSARIGFLITTGDRAEDARHCGQEALRALTFDVVPHQAGRGTGTDLLG